MEKNNQNEPQAVSHLPPPEQSGFSTVLNGMGNGLMLGAVPFVLLKTGQQLFGAKFKVSEQIIERVGTFGSVIGCGVGAMYGVSEAKQVESYRNSVSNEIVRLGNQLDAADSKIADLTRALEAKEKAAEPAR